MEFILTISSNIEIVFRNGGVFGYPDDSNVTIVNPVDMTLSGSGGLDKLVHDEINKINGDGFYANQLKQLFPTGIFTTQCGHTSGYGRFAGVINSVGPDYRQSGFNNLPPQFEYLGNSFGPLKTIAELPSARMLLAETYKNIFLKAREFNCSVLRIPPISSGAFRGIYSVDEFAPYTLKAIEQGIRTAMGLGTLSIRSIEIYSMDLQFHNKMQDFMMRNHFASPNPAPSKALSNSEVAAIYQKLGNRCPSCNEDMKDTSKGCYDPSRECNKCKIRYYGRHHFINHHSDCMLDTWKCLGCDTILAMDKIETKQAPPTKPHCV